MNPGSETRKQQQKWCLTLQIPEEYVYFAAVYLLVY